MLDARTKANKQLKDQQQHKEKLMASTRRATLEEDPDVFEYDSMYDDIQAQRDNAVVEKQQSKARRESRYIQQLLDKGEDRQTEQGIVYERVLRREREKEDHLFEDKEKFVTQGYKDKLITDKRWEEKEAVRVSRESDVTTTGSSSGFLGNLLNSGATSRSTTSSLLKKEQAAVVKSEAQVDAVKLERIAAEQIAEDDKLRRAALAEAKRKEREEQHRQERIAKLQQEKEEQLQKEREEKARTETLKAAGKRAASGELEAAAKKAKPEQTPISEFEKVMSAKERYLARMAAKS
jgi:coiled-coil domain-containing protein 55